MAAEIKETTKARGASPTLAGADGEEYVKVSEARTMLGCSKNIVARFIRDGTLSTRADELDKRIKWIRRADVVRLQERSPKSSMSAAAKQEGAEGARRPARARSARKVGG